MKMYCLLNLIVYICSNLLEWVMNKNQYIGKEIALWSNRKIILVAKPYDPLHPVSIGFLSRVSSFSDSSVVKDNCKEYESLCANSDGFPSLQIRTDRAQRSGCKTVVEDLRRSESVLLKQG
jgi:hypothetical protein